MPSLSNVIRNGIASLSGAAGATDVHLTIRVSTTGQQGRWPVLPVGLAMDVDAAPNTVSRAVVGVASGQPTLTVAYATYSVRITAPLGNAYTSGTQVVFLPLLLPIDDLDDITLRKGQTASINLFRHFLYSGGDQSDIVWSISPANSNQPVGYLSRSGTSVTIHASGAGRVQMVIGASAGGSTLRHTAYLTVTDANRAPVVTHNPPGITLKVSGNGAAIHPAAFFTDADGDTLTITAVASGVGVVLQDDGGGVWSVQPLSAAGTAQVVWTANDGHGGVISATQVFTLGPNRAPIVVHSIVPQAVLVNRRLTIPLGAVFSDPDNDALSYLAYSEDTDVALVVAGDKQSRMAAASWFTQSGGITLGQTNILLDSVRLAGSYGSNARFLIGAYLALGGQRALISGASVVWSYRRPSDGQRVTRLTLTLAAGGFPLAVAGNTQVYIRNARVALSGAALVLDAGSTPSTTNIAAIATDGIAEVSDRFSLIVHRAPVWQNIPRRRVTVGSAIAFNLADFAIEPDGDALTYSITSADSGVAASLRGAELFVHGLLASSVRQNLVVRATDQYGAFAERSLQVNVDAPASAATRAPIITRERYHERIHAVGDDVVYTPLNGASVAMRGIVDRGQYEIGTSEEGIAFSVPGSTRLTISDIALRTLDADSQALLVVSNLGFGTPAHTGAGKFLLRGEEWLLAGVEAHVDSGHILAHTFTLDQLQAGGVPVTPPTATPDVQVQSGTSATFTYDADLDAIGVTHVSGPSWWSNRGTLITFAPPSDTAASDYTFVFRGFDRNRFGEVLNKATQTLLVRVLAASTPI